MTRKVVRLAARWTITGALGTYLIWQVDLGSVFTALYQAAPLLLAASVTLYGLDRLAAGAKWQVLYRGLGNELSLWRACVIYLQSSFLGAALPATVGMDVIRAKLVVSDGEGSFTQALTSVVVERVAGIVALAMVSGLGLAVFAPADAIATGLHGWLALVGVFLVAILALLLVGRHGGFSNGGDVESGFLSAFGSAVESARAALEKYSARPRILVFALAIAGGQHYLLTFINWLLARAVGLDVSLVTMLWLWPLVMIAVRIPISVMGFGVREGVLFSLAGLSGFSEEAAVSFGLLSGFLDLVFVGVGGLFVLSGAGRPPRDPEARAAELPNQSLSSTQ